MKKGVIDVQFNWIFIMIAGVVILGFFLSVASSLREGSEQSIQVDVGIDMRTTLIGVKVGQSATSIPVPTIDMRIDRSGLRVGDYQTVNIGPIFGPEVITGNRIVAWSHDWSIPMRMDNFLYLTPAGTKFLFIDDGAGYMEELLEDFPKELNGEVVECDLDAITDALPSGNVKTQIINIQSLGAECDPVTTLTDDRFTYIVLDETQGFTLEENLDEGEVGIYNPPSRFIGTEELTTANSELPDPAWPFFGEAVAYAAMFSNDHELFKAMMDRAFKGAAMVLKTYDERVSVLVGRLDSSITDSCGTIYTSNVQNDILPDLIDNLEDESCLETCYDDINQGIRDLRTQNEELQRRSCPLVY